MTCVGPRRVDQVGNVTIEKNSTQGLTCSLHSHPQTEVNELCSRSRTVKRDIICKIEIHLADRAGSERSIRGVLNDCLAASHGHN